MKSITLPDRGPQKLEMTHRIISEKLLYPDALGGRYPTPKPVQNAFKQKYLLSFENIWGSGPHGHDATAGFSIHICICICIAPRWFVSFAEFLVTYICT